MERPLAHHVFRVALILKFTIVDTIYPTSQFDNVEPDVLSIGVALKYVRMVPLLFKKINTHCMYGLFWNERKHDKHINASFCLERTVPIQDIRSLSNKFMKSSS